MKLGWTKYPDAKFWTVYDETAGSAVASKVKSEQLARLFAAAPELFEALDRAHLEIIKLLNDGDFKRHVVLDIGYIVDAIEKAKGGS